MPVITSCPDCGRKLRVPDQLIGKLVRCPGCKVAFKAAADAGQANVEPAATTRAPVSSDSERFAFAPAPTAENDDIDVEREPASFEEVDDRGGSDADAGDRESWRRVRDGIGYIL